jgi:hypothetical protein
MSKTKRISLLKRFLALLALAASTAGPGHAGNVVLPPEPSRDAIPSVNQLGERVRGIALPTTTVVRWSDGEIMVLYGYIVGRMSGASDYFYWNKATGVECHGITRRAPDGSGQGVFSCSRNGATLLQGDFQVVPETYMKLKGSIAAAFAENDGGVAEVRIAWQGRSRFPDPRPLIAALR